MAFTVLDWRQDQCGLPSTKVEDNNKLSSCITTIGDLVSTVRISQLLNTSQQTPIFASYTE
jgi:hypothetical protein